MESSTNERTSFVQFQYCSICRINHKQKKKHVYSTRHQTIIKNILEKFNKKASYSKCPISALHLSAATRRLKKIRDAKCTLECPEVESFVFENGAKFWCYFCIEEIPKHQQLGNCTLKYGGLLDHIASNDHQQKTTRFFRDNRVDEKQLKTSDFILDTDEINSFKEKSELCIRKFEQKQQEDIQKGAQKIYNTEMKSKYIHQSGYHQSPSEQKFSAQSKGGSTNQRGRRFVRSTISAHGEGLTFIGVQHVDEEEGNVHTGGVPPWLRPNTDEADDQKKEIGPTLSDFERHLEQEKKKKLPACRVGAKFDHKTPTSSQWLPSFGRVWNHGRRQQSKSFFEKQSKTQQMRNEFDVPKSDKDLQTTVQPQVVPYKRRKTATKTSGSSDTVGSEFYHSGNYHTTTRTQNQNTEIYSSMGSHSNQQTPNYNSLNNRYNGKSEFNTNVNSTQHEKALSRTESLSSNRHNGDLTYMRKYGVCDNGKSNVFGESVGEIQQVSIKPYVRKQRNNYSHN